MGAINHLSRRLFSCRSGEYEIMSDKYIFFVGFGVFCLMLGYIFIFLTAIRTMIKRDEIAITEQANSGTHES